MAKEVKEKSGVSKSVMVMSTVLCLFMGVIVFAVFVMTNPEATKLVKDIKIGGEKEKEEFYGPPIEFLAEVKSEKPTSKPRYMQGGITVSMTDKKKAEKLKEKNAKFTDLYIRFLGTQTAESLKTIEGQNTAKKELEKLIEKEIHIDVEGVYFTKWIFQ